MSNDFVTFAAGANANTLTPVQYAQLVAVLNGFTSGTASSAQFNTFARQVSTVCTAVAQFIADTLNEDVQDNGNAPQFASQFEAALVKYSNAPPPAALVHGGVDSGGTNNLIIAAAPTITALRPYMVLVTFPVTNAANATAQAPATLQITSSSAPSINAQILRADGSPIQAGDWSINQPVAFICDGQNWRLLYTFPVPRYFGRATGTSDQMTVATNPSFSTLIDGHILDLMVVGPNTTFAPTVNPNTLGAFTLQRQDGTPLAVGDLVGGYNSFIFDLPSRTYRLRSITVSSIAQSGMFQQIVSNPVIWVRNDGNDNNDGSANTPQSAFATLTGAIIGGSNRYNFASSSLTVRLGSTAAVNNFPTPPQIPAISGTITVVGDNTNPQNYQIVQGAGQTGGLLVSMAQSLNFSGVQLVNPGQGSTIAVTAGSVSTTSSNLVCPTGNFGFHFLVNPGGQITANTGTSLSGSGTSAFFANGGIISMGNNPGSANVTINSASLTLATAFFQIGIRGTANLLNQLTFTGSANGPQWNVGAFGILNTGGRTGAFVPGTASGNYVSPDGRVY